MARDSTSRRIAAWQAVEALGNRLQGLSVRGIVSVVCSRMPGSRIRVAFL